MAGAGELIPETSCKVKVGIALIPGDVLGTIVVLGTGLVLIVGTCIEKINNHHLRHKRMRKSR